MKRDVIWSPAGQSDLFQIVVYVMERNPSAAERIADRIENRTKSLGEDATGRPGRVSGTFEQVVRGLPYIIAYQCDDEGSAGPTISVLRVIHGARHWLRGEWPADRDPA